ncbi:Protein of unknown function (DUF2931) [Pseudomonas sp. GM21]|jgi:hypothetical protein|uniref:DUF2931 family protein n=1 Tax=unclassified Pseudomonas TaxID=196821 RepID=UPI0002725EF8|nr:MULTISPECIES: DUF2931 family protein [unclassified Pseudomonas]EJM21452.1 Protein of unknown function (DUF2931) [Pseudomonas sp. GM21]MDR6927774.1 hypothetical protein [Pseudomonas sp. BE134]
MRTLWILFGVLLVSGCQASDQSWRRSDPDAGPWALGFVTPYAMDGWVEDAATIDTHGTLYRRINSGASGGKKNGKSGARGWAVVGTGTEREVRDAKLPVRIYVRWQSLVEPQTYQGWIEIPEDARQVLRKALSLDCPSIPEMAAIPKRASVRLGLAPGGVVQVWAFDECLHPVKVAHAQVGVEPKGPGLGLSGGSYFPLEDDSKRYVEKYGIPYGSW